MPEIDLEPHEYQRHQREKQPVFLPGGKMLVLYVVGMIAFGIVLTLMVQPVAHHVIGLARAFVEGQ